jgi:Family of unknown function (DUF5995)
MPLQFLKFLLLALALFIFTNKVLTQINNEETILLLKLDSLSQQKNSTSHFAKLYAETFTNTILYFQNEDKSRKVLANRFETSLASFFFKAAAMADKNTGSWQTYFADTTHSPFQYQLLGINAHINGDIWQALTKEFTLNELREFKPIYLSFLKKGMVRQYNDFYMHTALAVPKVRLLHFVSLGLSKNYGRLKLVAWGKRQLRLGLLNQTNPAKFARKQKSLNRKTMRLNQLILRNF